MRIKSGVSTRRGGALPVEAFEMGTFSENVEPPFTDYFEGANTQEVAETELMDDAPVSFPIDNYIEKYNKQEAEKPAPPPKSKEQLEWEYFNQKVPELTMSEVPRVQWEKAKAKYDTIYEAKPAQTPVSEVVKIAQKDSKLTPGYLVEKGSRAPIKDPATSYGKLADDALINKYNQWTSTPNKSASIFTSLADRANSALPRTFEEFPLIERVRNNESLSAKPRRQQQQVDYSALSDRIIDNTSILKLARTRPNLLQDDFEMTTMRRPNARARAQRRQRSRMGLFEMEEPPMRRNTAVDKTNKQIAFTNRRKLANLARHRDTARSYVTPKLGKLKDYAVDSFKRYRARKFPYPTSQELTRGLIYPGPYNDDDKKKNKRK